MSKVTIVIRGRLNNELKESIESILEELGLGDTLFITDIKTHSIDFIADPAGVELNSFVNKIKQDNRLSLIKSFPLNDKIIIVMGRIQDSGITQAVQARAKGLFDGS